MCNLCPSVMNGVVEVCSAHRASICGALEVCSHQYPADALHLQTRVSFRVRRSDRLSDGLSASECVGRIRAFALFKKKRVEGRKRKKQKLLLSLPIRPRDIFFWWR